jgi:hypothetical protein
MSRGEKRGMAEACQGSEDGNGTMPASRRPEPDLLRRGKEFGKLVVRYYQYRYEHETQFEPERYLLKKGGKSGRTDLLLWADFAERLLVIVEVKNTDWDALHRRDRVRANLRRHIRQMWLYLEGELRLAGSEGSLLAASLAAEEEKRSDGDSRAAGEQARTWFPMEELERTPAIIYPQAPTTPGLRESIEQEAAEWGISIIWFDEPPRESDAWVAWEAMREGKL